MNRVFTLGIAIFFALIGMALIGGERQVDAAFGCHGCFGGHHQRCGGLFAGRHHASCCAPEPVCCEPAPSCCGPRHKRHHHCGGGLFARLRARHNCCAPEPTCCAPVACDTCGSAGCDTGCAPEPTCCAPEPTCAAPEAYHVEEGSYDAPPEAPAPEAPAAPAEASPSEAAPPAPPAEA